MQAEIAGLEPEAVQSELADGAVEGGTLAGRVDEPLVDHGEPPQAVREPPHGLGEIAVEPAVDVPGLHHCPVYAHEVHLRDHQLRRRGEPGQRRRQVLQAVIDAVHGPREPAVRVSAEVDLSQVVKGRVIDVRERLAADYRAVVGPAHRLVVRRQHLLQVARVAAGRPVSGRAAHRRKRVRVRVYDHGGQGTA